MELKPYIDEMALFPPLDSIADRHLTILNWLTRLSLEAGYESPILVGCGAVELYTDAQTATGDIDLITPDSVRLTSTLLQLGFKRSKDYRYCYHPTYSLLLEFASDYLRPGEESVRINIDGVECLIISPEDLIVDRLESFEAAGGGTDLIYAYLIYYLHHSNLNHARLRDMVRKIDVRESFRFIRRLYEFTKMNNLSIDEQGSHITNECRRRRGIEWLTGLS